MWNHFVFVVKQTESLFACWNTLENNECIFFSKEQYVSLSAEEVETFV